MSVYLLPAQIESTYSPIQQVSTHVVLHKTCFLIRKQDNQEYGNTTIMAMGKKDCTKYITFPLENHTKLTKKKLLTSSHMVRVTKNP